MSKLYSKFDFLSMVVLNSAYLLMEPGAEQPTGQPRGLDKPFDTAGNLRALLQKETKGKIAPTVWLRFKIKNMLKESIGTKAPEAKANFYLNVFNAYSILAFNKFPENYRPTVALDLRIWADDGVTLEDPKEIQLLQVMAEATDIPYTPGQTRFDLPSEAK